MRRRLPLFPLPVVLFPEAVLPLHIFEPRYRHMVARCLELDRMFGLLYHDPDRMGPFLLEEGRVGCVAEIQSFQPLPDGRSLILVKGRERFRISDGLESQEPFYEAVVEEVMDGPPGEEALAAQRRRSVALFRAAFEALDGDPEELPDLTTDHELSFRLAATVRIDAGWQQSLLELRSEVRRLERLDAIFHAASDGVEEG